MKKLIKICCAWLFSACLTQGVVAQIKLPNVQASNPQSGINKIPVKSNLNVYEVAGEAFSFSQDNIKLIVLLHGITSNKIETGPPTSTYYDQDVSCNTVQHVKAYFGYQFVLKLLGYNGNVSDNPEILERSTSLPVVTNLAGTEMRTARAFYQESNNRSRMDNMLYRLQGRNDIFVLLSPRDGSIAAIDQTKAALSNIDSAYRFLEKSVNASSTIGAARRKVSMHFVCHSGGGIVTRMILKPNLNFDNKTLDERKASFVRDRIANVTTISTPHDGSPLPSKVNALVQSAQMGDDFLASLLSANSGIQYLFSSAELPNITLESLLRKMPSMEVRLARDQMAIEFIRNFNILQGDPKYARRSDSTLIPIHCLGGRQPTGPFYNNLTQDFLGGMPNYYISKTNTGNGATYEVKDRLMAMYVLGIPPVHFLLHKLDVPGVVDPLNWGAIGNENESALFDRKRWGIKNIGGTFQPYSFSNGTTGLATSILYTLPGNDGEVDTDGFVSFKSALGYSFGTGMNNYFDHTSGGSIYRFYDGPFEEHNHGTITRSQNVAQFIMDNVVNIAGPYVSATGISSQWTKQ